MTLHDATYHSPMYNTISSMVFAIRAQLLLETWLVYETQLLLEETQYVIF